MTTDPSEALSRLHARIDLTPTSHVSAASLAAATDFSQSELRTFLETQTGTSPVEFILNHRLDAVRSSRRTADVDVPDAARRWGFVHLGRFSAAYTRRHGQAPAETAAGAATEGCWHCEP
ncbi:helix-turn-helix domain-containing protein [Curtobacterium sp. MCPF17_003]|uniref:helix-turn-helix domain-containing protein n=1 Tax=Curtobacterium sp. MCPF17_003 TaxID=2175637 RepID=UPI0015E8906C|nr:helix-turn-helix domain-containing protein [Curtobacterium sp. MCPF17_003]